LLLFPTLAKVADVAAFVASDRASAITRAIANLTCGSLVDQPPISPSPLWGEGRVRGGLPRAGLLFVRRRRLSTWQGCAGGLAGRRVRGRNAGPAPRIRQL